MPWEVVPRSGGKAGCQPQSATQDCGNSGVRKQEDATAQTPPELVRSITWDQGTEMEKAPFHALAPRPGPACSRSARNSPRINPAHPRMVKDDVATLRRAEPFQCRAPCGGP